MEDNGSPETLRTSIMDISNETGTTLAWSYMMEQQRGRKSHEWWQRKKDKHARLSSIFLNKIISEAATSALNELILKDIELLIIIWSFNIIWTKENWKQNQFVIS